MDTYPTPEPTTPEPVPARDGRDAPSRLRVLSTSVAIAGLTATGGLAVILSTAATSGSGTGTADANATPVQPAPAASAPSASLDPNAASGPSVQGGTQSQPQGGGAEPFQLGGQAPQPGRGTGPGHASSGGS